jgi:hypothetical protein
VKPKLMRAYLVTVTAALIFVSGVAVGQGPGTWRVGKYKYLTASDATKLDWKFLAIQVQQIQQTLDVLEELELPNHAGVPTFSLNPKTGRVQVLLTAHGNWVDKAPLEEVQKSLKDEAQNTLLLLKLYMRELSDADIEIRFSKVNTATGEIVNDFAEYKDGALTIRH